MNAGIKKTCKIRIKPLIIYYVYITGSKESRNGREIKALIQDTMNLRDPYGIPTLFMTHADFYNVNFAADNVDKKIHKQIRKKIGHADEQFQEAYERTHDIYRAESPHFMLKTAIGNSIKRVLGVDSNAYGMMIPLPFYGYAHKFHNPQDLPEAQCAITILSSGTHDQLFGADQKLRSKFHFTALWHELAHTTFAHEPQADLMAGIMTRKSIADQAGLRLFSDFRAYTAFAFYDNNAVRPTINWHVVDACDYAATMPQNRVDALDEDQIKSLRFLRFGNSHKAASRTFSALHKKFNAATGFDIKNADFEALSAESDDLLHKWRGRKGRSDYAVLQRFYLAVTRLNDVNKAYAMTGQGESMDKAEQAIRSEGYRLNFMPKSLPEFLPPP